MENFSNTDHGDRQSPIRLVVGKLPQFSVELGPRRRQFVVADAHAGGDARAEVLHKDVGRGDEAAQHVASVGRAQVDGDGPFAAVRQLEHRRHPTAARRHMAREIARPRRLDFDHLGALVG